MFRYGPKESYIWFAVNELANGAESPHLEGMFVWNSVHKRFDMLVAIGMNGPGFEEQGSLSVERDGTVVREITAFFPQGTPGMGKNAPESQQRDCAVPSDVQGGGARPGPHDGDAGDRQGAGWRPFRGAIGSS